MNKEKNELHQKKIEQITKMFTNPDGTFDGGDLVSCCLGGIVSVIVIGTPDKKTQFAAAFSVIDNLVSILKKYNDTEKEES